MQRQAIKDLVYGGLMEIMKNRQYYYHSGIGSHYSHFTDEGTEAVREFLNVISGKMMEAEDEELDQRARQQVLNQLKKSD